MSTLVVYTSKTGSTKKYAEAIAARLNATVLPAVSATVDALAKADTVIYGGWLFAGKIRGLAKVKPHVKRKLIVFAVGVTPTAEIDIPELGFAVAIGEVRLTECQMVNQFKGSTERPPQFTRGYGLVFGQSERKAMAMSLCDRALRANEYGEEITAPAQDEEFVISHCDNVEATGFVEHLKLPHYVDFQAELGLVRRLRAAWQERGEIPVDEEDGEPIGEAAQ